MKLFDSTLGVLERSLDVRLARQNLIAGNIANANTPGYAPVDLDFASAMAAAAHAQDGAGAIRGQPAPSPFIEERPTAPGLDGNRVELDREMVALAENALQYGASARAASKKLAILRAVASDGNA